MYIVQYDFYLLVSPYPPEDSILALTRVLLIMLLYWNDLSLLALATSMLVVGGHTTPRKLTLCESVLRY